MPRFQDPADREKFGNPELIKRVRKQLGLTQEELARRSGLKSSYIANIEARGRRRPSEDALIAIWDALEAVDSERRKTTPLKDNLVPMAPLSQQLDVPAPAHDPVAMFRKENELLRKLLALSETALQRAYKGIDELYGLHKEYVAQIEGKDADKQQKIAQLEEKISLLSSLCDVKTRESLAHVEAEELKEKIEDR
jgi:transcriptional regulator with XRE-family HTH domain